MQNILQPCLGKVQDYQDTNQTAFDSAWQSIIHVCSLEGEGNGTA